MFIIRKNERTLNKIRNFKLIEKSNEREKRFFLKNYHPSRKNTFDIKMRSVDPF